MSDDLTFVHDPLAVRLGRLPARADDRTLRLATYMAGTLPPSRPAVDYLSKVSSFPLYDNSVIGDCTCAAAAHLIESWTAYAGSIILPADAAVLQAYEQVGGYVPGQPNTDHGAVMLDVLRRWASTGLMGRKITAYVAVNHLNRQEVELALEWFGGLYVGVALPRSAQFQAIWQVVPDPMGTPGSWGGHAIQVGRYDQTYLYCTTWGAIKQMTWDWWNRYVEECWAILSPDWLSDEKSPEGLDIAALQGDLQKVRA